MIRVLVVDDSALMRKAIKSMLSEEGDFDVAIARNGEEAVAEVHRLDPDVVTLDVNMPVMDGITALSRIMEESPRPVVMVSSLTAKGALVTLEALELGAVDYVAKPDGTVSRNLVETRDDLVGKVRQAAQARRKVGGLAARLRRQREEITSSARVVRRPRARATATWAGTVDLVVIGASTGGPALLADMVTGLPEDFPAPVVIAQHMPAAFTTALAARLDGACRMPVVEVASPMPLTAGRVYVARGDADSVVVPGLGGAWVKPAPASRAHRWHPSVDRLVETAMAVTSPRRMIGILLTGMGDDGAEQMTRLHAAGGRTIAESEASAVVWGMPGQLVARDGADAVLDAADIPHRLLAWV